MKRKPKLPVEETELRADAMPAKPPELSPDECATLDDLEKLMRADASQGIGVPVLEEPSESDLYWEQEYRDEPAPPWEFEDEVLAKLKAKKVSKFDEWVRAEVAWADDHHGPQGYEFHLPGTSAFLGRHVAAASREEGLQRRGRRPGRRARRHESAGRPPPQSQSPARRGNADVDRRAAHRGAQTQVRRQEEECGGSAGDADE